VTFYSSGEGCKVEKIFSQRVPLLIGKVVSLLSAIFQGICSPLLKSFTIGGFLKVDGSPEQIQIYIGHFQTLYKQV
jgi:hypothetical protein